MIIAPVTAPPSQVQITQNSDLAKLAIGSPNLTATPTLKKKVKIAQVFPAPSGVLSREKSTLKNLSGELQNSEPLEATQYPKARIIPSPLGASKEQDKSEQAIPEPLTPDQPLQKPEQLLPESQPLIPDIQPGSKEQQKSQLLPPLVPDVQPEQQKLEQLVPETKQDSKQQAPPPPLIPPSEVIPPQQQQNPLPSGPPPVEPGNYPNNTGPGSVYYNQNYIAPAISFGRDTLIGAASRFGIGKNISVRPSLFLGSTTRLAVPITYDFGFNDNEQFEKNPLVIFHAGGGLDYSANGGTNQLNPLVVFGADVYLGDGASVLLQIGNAFNSDFVAVAGIGLQF